MKKGLTIVAGSMNTARGLRDQLKEYIDSGRMQLFSIEDGILHEVKGDVVLYSSELTRQDVIASGYYCPQCTYLVADRTVNYDYIDQIVTIPMNTQVLLVNDLPETVHDMIDNLVGLGLDHLKYTPYCPGMPLPPEDIKIAITPGESDKVPPSIEKIYDIGPRLLDFVTVTQVLMALEGPGNQAVRYSRAYLEKIIRIAKRLAASHQEIEASKIEVQALNQQLNRVIDGLKEGLMVYDQLGTIKVINDYCCQILGVKQSAILGRPLKSAFAQGAFLDALVETKAQAQAGVDGVNVFNLSGVNVSLSSMLSPSGDVIVSIKKPDAIVEEHRALQQELARKGFTAKYGFEHIVGNSHAIQQAKRILSKLAKSEITLLIHGESGTGKELFASAVHRGSSRKFGPFLAINFSALPDELIESELFGYEDGAFTGAKKGGKAGLFEQAHGGTLFLDEIGDVSPKVQARLLRVLQEGEIMRIGAQEIKRVDVRVVAATNKDLRQKVEEGTFREDLYYRLQMGYVQLPPLRSRLEDVPFLVAAICKSEAMHAIEVETAVMEIFLNHKWPGNVRELKNCLRYMVALSEGHVLTVDDLPETLKAPQEKGRLVNDFEKVDHSLHLTEEEVFILQAIAMYEGQKEACGREKLSAYTMGTAYSLTKYQMRLRLERLAQSGYLTLGRGKVGVKLTDLGASAIKTPL